MTIGCGHVDGLARYEHEQAEAGRVWNEAEEALRRGDLVDEVMERVEKRAADILRALFDVSDDAEVFLRLLRAGGAGVFIAGIERDCVQAEYERRMRP